MEERYHLFIIAKTKTRRRFKKEDGQQMLAIFL
jgi:hypothetical protein